MPLVNTIVHSSGAAVGDRVVSGEEDVWRDLDDVRVTNEGTARITFATTVPFDTYDIVHVSGPVGADIGSVGNPYFGSNVVNHYVVQAEPLPRGLYEFRVTLIRDGVAETSEINRFEIGVDVANYDPITNTRWRNWWSADTAIVLGPNTDNVKTAAGYSNARPGGKNLAVGGGYTYSHYEPTAIWGNPGLVMRSKSTFSSHSPLDTTYQEPQNTFSPDDQQTPGLVATHMMALVQVPSAQSGNPDVEVIKAPNATGYHVWTIHRNSDGSEYVRHQIHSFQGASTKYDMNLPSDRRFFTGEPRLLHVELLPGPVYAESTHVIRVDGRIIGSAVSPWYKSTTQASMAIAYCEDLYIGTRTGLVATGVIDGTEDDITQDDVVGAYNYIGVQYGLDLDYQLSQ